MKRDQILSKTGRLIMKPSESGAPELGEAVPMQHAPPDMTCDSAACSDPKLDNYNNYNYRVSTIGSLK